ncbi:MAG: UDP-N-acetylmuramate dehydrogenase [Planctomycetaceae bacterium]
MHLSAYDFHLLKLDRQPASPSMQFPDSVAHLVQPDFPLASLLWLGIGGPARYYAEPTNREELVTLARAAIEQGVAVRVLGGGSNVLAREAGVDGLVLSLSASPLSQYSVDDTRLTTGGGAKLSHVVTHAVGAGLGGLEHLLGIPGTVAGALIGNASADGRDIGLVTAEVEVLQPDGSIAVIRGDEAQFSHCRSGLSGTVILQAVFQLDRRDPAALTKRMQKLWIVRSNARPRDVSRIAMPFVDPDGATAERLIADIGLAGAREGGASLNAEHPHFLVASESATSQDCLRLIERVREQVLIQTGIDLQSNLQIW